MIKEVLMRRDNMSAQEADESIAEGVELLREYIATDNISAAENICEELWGLEPDYILELL